MQNLQKEVDGFQANLADLYRLGDEVTKQMDTPTIVTITSRQTNIEQRLTALRQMLAKHLQNLQQDVNQYNRFLAEFDAVTKFLAVADSILAEEDPNKSMDDDILNMRLEQLKDLMLQFHVNQSQLDTLNDLGYRLALCEVDATNLKSLNHRWQKLYREASERCREVQGTVLGQQDFAEKCDTWMTFLAQTEKDLSTEIRGNLADLMEQLRNCEVSVINESCTIMVQLCYKFG